jgi:hypothetical protein
MQAATRAVFGPRVGRIVLGRERPAIAGNLARIYVRTNRKDDRTRQLLSDIVLKDTRPAWVAWAQERLAIFGKAEPVDSPAGPPK